MALDVESATNGAAAVAVSWPESTHRAIVGLLDQRASKWRKAMADADTGPLTIAKEVCEVAENWSAWQDQAKDLGANEWLRLTFGEGKSLAFWQRRHEAVQKLGEAVRRTVHHDVAVWIVNSFEAEADRRAAVQAVMKGRKENGDNCLTLVQARRVVTKALSYKPRHKTCARCTEKGARIAELEAEVARLRG